METAELIKKVRKIEIKTKGLTKHLFSGDYHSAFKGRGMSFSEVREYQFGDDIRNIDWNVTARTGEAFVKVYEEERELTVFLLVDVSNSIFFGSAEQLKSELLTEISAVLAFSAISNNDKVGMILFSEEVELFIPPKKGKKHILRIIRELVNFRPSNKRTNLEIALQYFSNVCKKKSICFILSDFYCPPFQKPLSIASKKHDVIGIQLIDPIEIHLPTKGFLQLRAAENGDSGALDLGNKNDRDLFIAHLEEKHSAIQNDFVKSGADYLRIQTNTSYTSALHQFFKKRASRK